MSRRSSGNDQREEEDTSVRIANGGSLDDLTGDEVVLDI